MGGEGAAVWGGGRGGVGRREARNYELVPVETALASLCPRVWCVQSGAARPRVFTQPSVSSALPRLKRGAGLLF